MLRTTSHPLAVFAAGGVLAMSTVLLAGCGEEEPPEQPVAEEAEVAEETESPLPEDIDEGEVESDAAEPTVDAEELLADTLGFAGETVVFEGTVADVLGEEAFTVGARDGSDAIAPDRVMLVVGSTTALEVGDEVTVGGAVIEGVDQLELEETYGADWIDGALDDFTGQAWLDASTIELKPA